jgi:TonB family protein
MQSFRFIVLLVVSLTAGILSIADGQSPAPTATSVNTTNWETLRPEGEEFSVLMPKGSTVEAGKQPYHKMELNTRIYLSQTQNGPVFAVVSLSGIKSNPAMYSEMQRVNSYVDAFKKLFTPKIRGKAAVAKLTLMGAKTLYGHAGRDYRMTFGDLSGTVHAFATRRRFYAVVYLNPKKDEPLQEAFLSSFVLPERIEAPPKEVAQAETPAPNPAPPAKEPATETASDSETAENGRSDATPENANPDTTATEPPATPESGPKPPLKAGQLNGRAISLPKPQHPIEARELSGTVVVAITIDEQGSVTSAHAISGPQPLRQAAINAALLARFSPTLLMGEPVKVTGVLTFDFVRPR